MQRKPSCAIAALASLMVIAAISGTAFGGDLIPWRPVSDAELNLKTAQVEPDADAEAIFWEVWLDDKKFSKLSYTHYVRVKIFTERGRERFAKMDIPFMKGKKVENVAARVIRPDGTILQLKPEDIFEREIVKVGKARVRAKSFAVPGIEPGVVVEYQYTETIKGESAAGERLLFQRDVPIQRVTYHVRPYSALTLKFNSYNMPDTKFVKEKDGYLVATLQNIPAYKEEPFMPPDDEVRKWMFLSYRQFTSEFDWNDLNVSWEGAIKKLTKSSKEIKQKAAELTAGAMTSEAKVRRIYEFVQKNIRNLNFDRALSEEEAEKLEIEDAGDALRLGMGRSQHIDILFAALVRAAGFETGVVLAADRSENFFSIQKYPFPSFLSPAGIAVKIDSEWRYFDPCGPFLPFGSLSWNREDVQAFIVGEGGPYWRRTPGSGNAESAAKRSGTFELSEDGTLAGTVKVEYTGQQAISRRREAFMDSYAKREEDFRNEIKQRISNAEVSAVSIENFDDTAKPLTYIYKVRIPGYAQKAGKRIILQPGYFGYGSSPLFSSSTRTYGIYFPYPWSESDKIEIKLPAGYQIDSADSPGELADSRRVGVNKIAISIDNSANVLHYHRSFSFGNAGRTLYPVEAYPTLKRLFDGFHKADTHAISLKQVTR